MISATSLKAIWNFRGFILGSVKREFQLRYRGPVLGLAWAAIQPLTLILVYTVVFSQIMKGALPNTSNPLAYGIYLCAGVITWGFFAETIQRGQSVFLDNANLLKKLAFPRITLPVIVGCFTLLNFAIAFALFLIFLIVTGSFPGLVALAAIPLLVIQMALALSLGVILGVWNVFVRDAGQISGLVLQLWFWTTPIVYPITILPDRVRAWMTWNPLFHLVSGYQEIFVNGRPPHWTGVGAVAVLAALLTAYAISLFRRRAGDIVDQV